MGRIEVTPDSLTAAAAAAERLGVGLHHLAGQMVRNEPLGELPPAAAAANEDIARRVADHLASLGQEAIELRTRLRDASAAYVATDAAAVR